MRDGLARHTFLVYSLPVITTIWLIAPIGIIQGIYAKYYGLALTTIATVVLVSRLFDAITDPIIGYCVDYFFRRTGTRKPLMLLGGLLFVVSSYFLYVPPKIVTATYFTLCFFTFYLAWTLFEIPHLAWASDLARTSKDKSKIYGYRSAANYLGLLFFYLIPLLPFFETRNITPQILEVSVIVAGVWMLIFLIFCLKGVSESKTSNLFSPCKVSLNANLLSMQETEKGEDILKTLKFVVRNRPFILFVTAYSFLSIASGMWYSLIFLYVDAYLGLGDQFAQIFLLAYAIGIVVTPIWYKLSILLGKRETWLLATVILIISFIFTGFLKPGETGFTELVALKIIQTLGFTCTAVVAPAMLSEIIDFSSWKHRSEKSATYFSLYTFLSKVTIAIAMAMGLSIAGWFGFDPTTTTHSTESIFGLTLAIAWIPPVFAAVAMFFILLSPIDARRHQYLRRRLDERAVRAATNNAQKFTESSLVN